MINDWQFHLSNEKSIVSGVTVSEGYELRVGIVGGGAVGTLLAYALNLSGIKPFVIYRSKAKKSRRSREGLRLQVTSSGGSVVYQVNAYHITYDELPDNFLDILLIATKAYDIREALLSIVPALSDNAVAISCQNGLWSLELLEKVLGKEKSAALILNAGVYEVDEVTYSLAGCGSSYLGQHCRPQPWLMKVAEILHFLNIKVVDDVEGYRWLKLIVNSAINPLTAILRAKNSIIIDNPLVGKLAAKVVLEGWLVSRELGITLPRNPIIELINVAAATGENYSSMYQDVIKGRRTEIDYINGAIVEIGERVGVNTVLNKVLTLLIKSIEGRG